MADAEPAVHEPHRDMGVSVSAATGVGVGALPQLPLPSEYRLLVRCARIKNKIIISGGKHVYVRHVRHVRHMAAAHLFTLACGGSTSTRFEVSGVN